MKSFILSILVVLALIAFAESKTFASLLPRELESDCGKLKNAKCCPNTCRRCNGGEVKTKKSACHWIKIKKNGRREKCCQWFVICKPNTLGKVECKNTKRKCGWTSKVVRTTKKSKCVFKRHLGGKQRYCCKWTEKCFGTKCYDLRKKCHWVGKIVTKKKSKWLQMGCYWKKHQKIKMLY